MKSVDFYNLLGVGIFASQEEIKAGYLKKIKQYHPDTYTGNKKEAEDITASLNQAYAVLSSKEQKEKYDNQFGFAKKREQLKKVWQKKQNKKSGSHKNDNAQNPQSDKQKGHNEQKPQFDEQGGNKPDDTNQQDTKKSSFQNDDCLQGHKIYTEEELQDKKDRLALDCIIIGLLMIVILILIFK